MGDQAMTDETRDAQLLRVLTTGRPSQDDWPAAAYLIEKGYGHGDCRRSNMEGSKGDILALVWQRTTANGLDFAEALRLKLDQAGKGQQPPQEQRSEHAVKDDGWHKKPIGMIGIALISGALLLILKHLLSLYFGISQ